ncbi:hypothetical protein PR048_014117 [Dryococelus australis]|uniref:MADF domain-containing protein n=1 Tax=Dryococelus australis TaxID=614101 RepID=A0ABQ9HD92_9NEOP|nr:hypothetical protein PR048_014117 [Dryococelus australis]
MSDMPQCRRQFLVEFIELYRSYPSLWQVKNKDYSNRNKKRFRLIKKCKGVDSSANKETVTNKINSLRSVYKKEMAKVNKSATSGT